MGMVFKILEKMVTNAVRGATNLTVPYFANKIAKSRSFEVRSAYLDMRSGLPYENKEFLEGGSDISFITDAFPKLVQSEGCKAPESLIPFSNRYTDGLAFRAELRRGEDDRKDKYIAVLWESYKNNANRYKLEYRTNDHSFVDKRRIG